MRVRRRRRNLSPVKVKQVEAIDRLSIRANILEGGVAEALKNNYETLTSDVCLEILQEAKTLRQKVDEIFNEVYIRRGKKDADNKTKK